MHLGHEQIAVHRVSIRNDEVRENLGWNDYFDYDYDYDYDYDNDNDNDAEGIAQLTYPAYL